ncbi:MAG: hypothetical protein L6Q37_03065 [Bdellovibrionaceae bacterium]|nr:hypothetical protein [Pseudobdellovibrionaceae bacterium]NUM57586.1 hypothetical protein [Pseudobdellovibrionaceae bacterium]
MTSKQTSVVTFLFMTALFFELSPTQAQDIAFDAECRVQAKEAALNTYQSCVKETRTNKIDEIRKEYQEKLTELKSHYEGELKKLAPTKNNDAKQSDSLSTPEDATITQPVIQLKKKTKKVSKKSATTSQLPSKKTISQTLPVQNNSVQETTISPESSPSIKQNPVSNEIYQGEATDYSL